MDREIPIDYTVIPYKAIIYNNLRDHQSMSSKKNLYQTLMNYYDKNIEMRSMKSQKPTFNGLKLATYSAVYQEIRES